MDKTFVFLTVLASFVILCQWFVFTSIRKYLFQRYIPVTRKIAYPTLFLLALINLVGSRLALDSDSMPVHFIGKQVAAVVYFSYLGVVLALCVLFLALGWISIMLDLKGCILRHTADLRVRAKCFWSKIDGESGQISVKDETPEKCPTSAKSDCNLESAPSKSKHGLSEPEPQPLMARRTFLKWSSAVGVTAVAAFSADGLAEAFEEPVVEQFDFLHPKLGGLSRPLIIAQVSDFHLGLFFDGSDLEHLVLKLNSLDLDALFITGDLFHSPMTRADIAVPILRQLKTRSIGNFAVLGNHDFYAGVSRSVECMKLSGLRVLRDQWSSHKNGSATIHIGGIDDPMGNWVWGSEFPRFGAFVNRVPAEDGLRILMSHRPNVLPSAARNHIDLVVSGHVHGGQIIVPVGSSRGVSIARIASHYTHGWYSESHSKMYLNRGVGLTFVPWRINCPPEIAVFHLKPSGDGHIRVVRTESTSLHHSGQA